MSTRPIPPKEPTSLEAIAPELYITYWGSQGSTFKVKGQTVDGTIEDTMTDAGDRSAASRTLQISDMPMSVTVLPVSTGIVRGQLYVRVRLRMGGFTVATLIAGYLDEGRNLSWPPGIQEPMFSGRGYIYTVTGTNPSATAEVDEAVPTNAKWRLLSIRIALTTSASSGNRGVKLQFTDGTNVLYLVPDLGGQGAGATHYYSFAVHAESRAGTLSAAHHANVIPDVILPQAYTIETSTSGVLGGDDYAAPIMLVEEWLEE